MASYYREPLRNDALPYLPPNIRRNQYLPGDLPTVKNFTGTACDERPMSPSYNKRYVQELQDQLRVFKDEVRRKDEILRQHNRYEMPGQCGHHNVMGPPAYPEPAWYTPDRHTMDATRAADVAGMQVKVDRLQQQLKDTQDEVERKDQKIKDLESTIQNQKEGEARLTAMLQTLRERMASMEAMANSYEGVTGRTEITISALQMENKEAHDRTRDLEARLKKILEEREEAQQKCDSSDKRHNDLTVQIRSLLRGNDNISDYSPVSPESLVSRLSEIISENAMLKGRVSMLGQNLNDTEMESKLSEIISENAMLKGRVSMLGQNLNDTEMESKASRETIMRLVEEVGREQRAVSDMDLLKVERDNAVASRRDLEKEIDLLKERLGSSQRVLDATRDELNQKDSHLSRMTREFREVDHSISSSKTQYCLFLEQLATMLGDAYCKVEANDTAIRNRIIQLQEGNKEKEAHIKTLEDKIRNLSSDFENQYGLHHTMASRAKQAEVDMSDMEVRLRSAEGELAAIEVLRDNFRHDKEMYMKFLERLADIMQMDRINLDIGMDMTSEALLARAEQLVRQEGDCITNKNTNVYNLQRKVKTLKEQTQSKELHVDLLRKKIATLEERVMGKTEIEKCRDGETLRAKKIEKLAEKYKMQLCEARNEITALKAQLLGSSELHVENLEQRKDMTDMRVQVEELERVRQKQARKIATLKQEVDGHEVSREEKRGASDNAVHALSSELRTTKNALGVIQDREKQLLDFRNVVARMLGLDISTLAIPDYEIISRLEKLVQAQHSFAFNTMGMGESLHSMEPNFVSGYRTAIANEQTVPERRARNRQRSRASARARSMSPRRDPRVY